MRLFWSLLIPACTVEKSAGLDSNLADSATDSATDSAADTSDTAPADPCIGSGDDADKRVVTCAMVDAATAFLASLDATELAEASYPLDDPERMDWDNRPNSTYPRKGVAFGELDATQLDLAYGLLRASLSTTGDTRAEQIIGVDQLAADAGEDNVGAQYYHVDVFGTPSMDAPWGWQLDGHHLAVSWTVSGAEVVMTPAFLGIRPTLVLDGDEAGLRVLGDLEDRAQALLATLTEEQKALAIVSDDPPDDIVVGPHEDGLFPDETVGIAASALTTDQQVLFLDLVATYTGELPETHAGERLAEVGALLDDTYFAWMGPTDANQLHYYRISGPTIWIEYDLCSAPDHLHTIWRDPLNDYGADLLAEHYAESAHGRTLRTEPIDLEVLSGVDRTLAHPLTRKVSPGEDPPSRP